MVKDDTKDQIPLFELPAPEKPAPPQPVKTTKTIATEQEGPSPEKLPVAKKPSARSAARPGKEKADIRHAAKKGKAAKTVPGPVPEGDVRLTANIREDLHLKLKIVAATRRTTIGELIEELVEHHL